MSELFYLEDDRICGQTDGAMEYGQITYSLRSKAITEKMQAEFIEVGMGEPSEKIGDIYSDSFREAFEYSENEILTIDFDNTLQTADDFVDLARQCLDIAKRLKEDKQKDLILYCY
jgi:hypothetical protein